MKSFKEFLNTLDPEGLDGTIQKFIMDCEDFPDTFPEAQVALYKMLVEILKNEKDHLVHEYVNLSRMVYELGGDIG